MDRDLGTAVFVPGLWSHDEPVAGLATSVALVCGDSDHRSIVSAFDLQEAARAISLHFGAGVAKNGAACGDGGRSCYARQHCGAGWDHGSESAGRQQIESKASSI
jgi:hypothetical protein